MPQPTIDDRVEQRIMSSIQSLKRNLFSEDSAQKKHCPFARAPYKIVEASPFNVSVAMAAVNRSKTAEFNCLASRCMAWRWHGNGDVGYCGLVGKPER